MSIKLKEFINSNDYQNFIGNDIDFPTEETAEKIIEYLLLKHEPRYLNKDEEDKESNICYFAYNYQALQKELNQNGDRGISQNYILELQKEILKLQKELNQNGDRGISYILKLKKEILELQKEILKLQKELNQNGDRGISQEFILEWNYPTIKYLIKIIDPDVNEDDKINNDQLLLIKETLKVWLSLLKISLTATPFDESLKYGDNDELLIPRLTQDETEFGFEFHIFTHIL